MSPQSNRARDDRGFTLLEVIYVALIISILLLIAIATFVATTGAANAAACRGNQDALNKAIMIAETTGDPAEDMDDLEPYVKNFDEITTCPKDGTPLIYDVVQEKVNCPNHP